MSSDIREIHLAFLLVIHPIKTKLQSFVLDQDNTISSNSPDKTKMESLMPLLYNIISLKHWENKFPNNIFKNKPGNISILQSPK